MTEEQADAITVRVIEELGPVSITLTGEEAMALAVVVLNQEGNPAATKEIISGLRRFGVERCLAALVEMGMDLPRFMKPLLQHIVSKFDEILKDEE